MRRCREFSLQIVLFRAAHAGAARITAYAERQLLLSQPHAPAQPLGRIAVLVGVYELTKALEKGGFRAPLVPLLVGGVVTEALAWTRGPTGLVVGFLVTALAVLLWRLADGPAGYLRDEPQPGPVMQIE